MTENRHNRHQHVWPAHRGVHDDDRPYWKRAHHDWRFWVAVFLMFAAMMIYVMSDDLAWRPRRQVQQPVSGAVGK
jgi:hypothetical protein